MSLLTVIGFRSFLLPNINGSPQPSALSLWGMRMLLISPKQSSTNSLQIPAYRAGVKRGFCPSHQPSHRLWASCQVRVCYRLLLHANLILRFLSLGDCFWSLAAWVMEAQRAPALGAERCNPGSNLAHSLAFSLSQQGSSWLPDAEGLFWHVSGKSSVALLIEHGRLICRLYSSDS